MLMTLYDVCNAVAFFVIPRPLAYFNFVNLESCLAPLKATYCCRPFCLAMSVQLNVLVLVSSIPSGLHLVQTTYGYILGL